MQKKFLSFPPQSEFFFLVDVWLLLIMGERDITEELHMAMDINRHFP